MKRKKDSSEKKKKENNYTQFLATKIRIIIHNFQHFFRSSVKFNGLNVLFNNNFY